MTTHHHPHDKRLKYVVIATAIAIILLWLWFRQSKLSATNVQMPNNGGTGAPSFNYDPEFVTYAADPGKFGPITVDGLVNVAVSGYNGLNQNYMPLFGFVGMAQNALWGVGTGGGIVPGNGP